MKRLSVFVFLGIMGFCVITAFSISRSIDTAAQLAADEIKRPPTSSEIIADSLDRRLYQEEGTSPLAFLGWIAFFVMLGGGLLLFYRWRGEYLRQKRLTLREQRQPGNVPRMGRPPRITIPERFRITEGDNHDRET